MDKTTSPLSVTYLSPPVGPVTRGVVPRQSSPRTTSSLLPTSNTVQDKMTSLREENTKLVSQGQRLVSELESTSHQLELANAKIHNLEGRLKKSDSITPQTTPPSTFKSPSTERRERQEWSTRQKVLQDQLLDVQEECRRLRDACVEAEQRTNKRADVPDRPLSSQSCRGFPSTSISTYTRHSNKTENILSNYKAVSGSKSAYSSLLSKPILTGGNSYPRETGLDRSLSGSNTSLSSVKSAREPLTFSTRSTFSSAYSSVLDSTGSSSAVELERAKIKIRKLEKEVTVLEQQLQEKTKLSETHVEDLTQLRSLLAQEKASHAISSHQAQEKAASELGRIKALHTEQCNDLETQLHRLKSDKVKLDEENAKLRTSLKGSQSEAKLLSDNVSKLLAQLDGERESHRASMERLKNEAEIGQRKVTELQRELKSCQHQLTQCLSEVEKGNSQRDKEIKELQEQVTSLSYQLQQCKEQLLQGSQVIHQLNNQLDTAQRQTKEAEQIREEKIAKLSNELSESNAGKQKLLEKLERANSEISTLSHQVTSLQESSLQAHQLGGEVLQLRQSLSDQQKLKSEHQRGQERAERDAERLKSERNDLKKRLEQCNRQLAEMQQRSEDWRCERERFTTTVRELQTELADKQRDNNNLKDSLQQAQSNNKQKEKDMESSIASMQQDLAKRAEQVMELDELLRKHQAETTSKRLQLERNLAQRQADLRSKTQELEDLSRKYAQSQKTIQDLQEELHNQPIYKPHPPNKELSSRLQHLEQQSILKDTQLTDLRQREAIAKEQVKQVSEHNHVLQNEVDRLKKELKQAKLHTQDSSVTASTLASRDQQITRLREQIQQLLEQERTRQEEVARCRAQVASLSAELAVERQMVEETRQQLAVARTAQRSNHLPHPVAVTLPVTSEGSDITSFSDIEYPHLPKQSSNPPSTNRANIIHI